jgi:hypothetical protein
MRLIKLALLSTLALTACRGGGDDSGDDTPMPDAPPGGSVKVKDVQNTAMPKGTAVELRGVVVTAIDQYGDRTGDFFVQDVEGGAFSGVKVFGGNSFLDPWGNHVQVVDYADVQFSKTPEILGGMGLELEKTDSALRELRDKGLA